MWRTAVGLLVLAAGAGLALTQEVRTTAKPVAAPAAKARATADSATDPVLKTLESYQATFNKSDAKAAADFWTERCLYVDRESGKRSEGRQAILADINALFKEYPKTQISVQPDNVRFIKPDVAMVEGRVTVLSPGLEPDASVFSAVLSMQGDRWLIDSVQETALPTPASASDALKDLAWMVGEWTDATEGIDVKTRVRWAAKHSFLIRSYSVAIDGDEPYEGTQVIGWDPRTKQIRSWSFDSDGSFDEGTWSKHSNEWLARLTRTTPDGDLASGTQVLKKIDDDKYTVQTIGRELAGEPQPSTELVTVVRVKAQTQDKK